MALGTLVGALFWLVGTCLGDEQVRYDGWSVVKAYPKTEHQLKFLSNLSGSDSISKLQVWQEGNLNGIPFDLFLSPQAQPEVLNKLEDLGVTFKTTLKDAQSAINAEKIPQSSRTRTFQRVANGNWFTRFLRLDEINAAVQQLARAYPNLVEVKTIGRTSGGRDITLAKVTSKNGRSKPGILLDGGIHAREWASPSTVLFILNKLVTGYSTDSNLRALVDGATWYIIPVLNPDGYEYTHTNDRMWRKNRSPGRFGSCVGVDLNRNFDYNFGGPGTSNSQCAETYRGPRAFSELESQALRDLIKGNSDIKAYITLHTYSQMWFYPYGDKKKSYPSNVKELKDIATRGAKALAGLYGTRYTVGTAADILYEAAGGSDDWAKGKAGIPYVFCLELRPGENDAKGFILPPSQIVPTGEETWAGLKVIADHVVNNGNSGSSSGYTGDTGDGENNDNGFLGSLGNLGGSNGLISWIWSG